MIQYLGPQGLPRGGLQLQSDWELGSNSGGHRQLLSQLHKPKSTGGARLEEKGPLV